ncbi:MAG TPA: hypothetical protein ENN07_04710 [candidate division Zixibacteria bacterium]|nr:hypothetical protein [candidate division Zixibacteria bacterium]
MKKIYVIIIQTIIAITSFALTVPITVDLVGADGRAVYADSAFCTVIADGETLLPWTAMVYIGRSSTYDFDLPDTVWLATAIVAAFWEDSLYDTTAFTIPYAVNPAIVKSMVAETLETAHGGGSWQSKAILPFLLTMEEEVFTATFSGASDRPISVYRGDSKTVDFYLVSATGDSVDITGAEAIFTARARESDAIAVIVDTLEIVAPLEGLMRLSLSSAKTSLNPQSYSADIQVTFPDGTVATVWRNRLIVQWDVTR